MTHDPAPGFTRSEERALRDAVARAETPHCPRCHLPLEPRDVPPRPDVAYVRRRTWWVCGGCRRSVVIDN